MLNIFRKNREEKVKELIFKKYFSSSRHKKIIKEAARKSAEDQRILVKKYEKMMAN